MKLEIKYKEQTKKVFQRWLEKQQPIGQSKKVFRRWCLIGGDINFMEELRQLPMLLGKQAWNSNQFFVVRRK